MKIGKYIFSDHYKNSTDFFRDLLGLYFTVNLNSGQVIPTSNPAKPLFAQSNIKFTNPELVNEENGLYKQTVVFSPINSQANIDFLSARGGATDGYVDEFGNITYKTNRDIINEHINDSSIIHRDYNVKTSRITNAQSAADAEYFGVNAIYNFFIKNYETFIAPDLIPEEVLPNFYVTSLARDKVLLGTITQKDFNNTEVADNLQYEQFKNKFDKFITLDENITLREADNVLVPFALIPYYEQYARVFDSVSIDLVDTMKTRFGSFFNNLTNVEVVQKLNEFKISYPMYMELLWETPVNSPLLQFLENSGMSLQAFQSFINEHILLDITSVPNSEESQIANYFPVTVLEYDNQGNKIAEIEDSVYTHEMGAWLNIFLYKALNGEDTVLLNAILDSVTFLNGDTATFMNGDTATLENIFLALGAKPKLNELLNNSIRSYQDIINGELAQSEILFYRIEKSTKEKGVIQNFYVTNLPGVNIQNFVDTQVKYNKEYTYKIYAYTVVYGTDYYYAPAEILTTKTTPDLIGAAVNIPSDISLADHIANDPSNTTTTDVTRDGRRTDERTLSNIGSEYLDPFIFDVYYSPNIQLVQLDYTEILTTKIVDLPPTPPIAEFYPIKDCSTRFNIALSPSAGEIRELPQVIVPSNGMLFSGDGAYFAAVWYLQGSPADGKIKFKYEGDIAKYELYRIDTAPTDYTDFATHPSSFKREIKGTENILFQEKIEASKDYYYTFRVIDEHKDMSNPSPIYKVKIYSNDGVEYLDVSTYEFKIVLPETTKSFKKYIKIDTALIQKMYSTIDNKIGLVDESVYDKPFVLRLISKHSGKQLDINVNFKKKDI